MKRNPRLISGFRMEDSLGFDTGCGFLTKPDAGFGIDNGPQRSGNTTSSQVRGTHGIAEQLDHFQVHRRHDQRRLRTVIHAAKSATRMRTVYALLLMCRIVRSRRGKTAIAVLTGLA